MRLSIDFEPTAAGWTLRYTVTGAELQLASRELTAKDGFPIPPDGGEAPQQIGTMLNDIITGEAVPGVSQAFGKYLTATLLGPHLKELRALPKGEQIELYLRIRATDAATQRLPWELMYDNEHPLAADPQQTFAVTRVVIAEEDRPDTTPMALPLKVLFVVGQALDGAIRPGAEYMALLRRVAGTDEKDVRVTNINSRLLLRATPEDLERAVDEFAPAIVHFICHGDYDEDQATLLLTKAENGKKTHVDHPVSAKVLLKLLRGHTEKAPLPTVIVLNACHTASVGPDRKNAYRGFAADLVAGGVPVAVGMAGEVADGACRIFTRELYQALLEGKSIVLATARGRRAALREYAGYKHTIEWARPSLFVASEEESTLPVDTTRASLGDAAAKYLKLAVKGPRALCGRFFSIEMFESLRQRLISGAGRDFVLGFVVSDPVTLPVPSAGIVSARRQYGKTRMLEEVASRLALAAIAPVLLEKEQLAIKPRNALELTVRLADQMNTTRLRFGGDERKPTNAMKQVLKRFRIDWNGPEDELLAIDEAYQRLPAEGEKAFDTTTVRELLALEFIQLVTDLTSKGITHAALLIDDLHVYEGAVQPLLSMITDHGLGKPGHIVPLCFSYLSSDIGNGSYISEFMNKNGYSVVTLGRFGPADPLQKSTGVEPLQFLDEKELPVAFQEEILALRQFLLTRHPQPLAVSAMPQVRAMITEFYQHLCGLIEGVPSRWGTDELLVALKIYSGKSINVLLDADDEAILERYGN